MSGILLKPSWTFRSSQGSPTSTAMATLLAPWPHHPGHQPLAVPLESSSPNKDKSGFCIAIFTFLPQRTFPHHKLPGWPLLGMRCAPAWNCGEANGYSEIFLSPTAISGSGVDVQREPSTLCPCLSHNFQDWLSYAPDTSRPQIAPAWRW